MLIKMLKPNQILSWFQKNHHNPEIYLKLQNKTSLFCKYISQKTYPNYIPFILVLKTIFFGRNTPHDLLVLHHFHRGRRITPASVGRDPMNFKPHPVRGNPQVTMVVSILRDSLSLDDKINGNFRILKWRYVSTR